MHGVVSKNLLRSARVPLSRTKPLGLHVVRGPFFLHVQSMYYVQHKLLFLCTNKVRKVKKGIKKNGAKIFTGTRVFATWGSISAFLIFWADHIVFERLD